VWRLQLNRKDVPLVVKEGKLKLRKHTALQSWNDDAELDGQEALSFIFNFRVMSWWQYWREVKS
jgi:hypothetical protein